MSATAPVYEPIYAGRDLRVPTFEVKIRGKDVPLRDIVAVRYSDAVGKIDSFELTVNNWEAETRDFKYTGAGRTSSPRNTQFDPGGEIELWMGYRKTPAAKGDDSPLRLMLAGVITSIAPSFPAAGQPTLKVSGQNVLRKLLVKQTSNTFESKKDSQIAQTFGPWKLGALDVKVKTDPEALGKEAVNDYVVQNNQYDIVFLLERAHRNGYDLLLQEEGSGANTSLSLYFGPPVSHPPKQYRLEWGRSLVQFDPTLTTTRQVTKVTVRFWNGVKKKVETVTAERKNLETKGMRDAETLKQIEAGFLESEDVITDQPFRDKASAAKFANARLTDVAKNFVKGKGSTFGTPDLRAGSVVELAGLGPMFTGRYVVDATTHTIGGSGYITEFEARLEEVKS